jgi:hypothetical protein
MRYRDAFTYVFRNPNWLVNLLVLALANVVPLIGPIFAFGYSATVTESLRGGMREDRYPTIDVDRLGDYLLRGLRMFLVSVLASLAIVPVYFLIVFGIIASSALGSVAESQGSGAAGAIGSAVGCVIMVGGIAVLVALMLAVAVLALPMHLRAALNPDIRSIFSVSYVRDFLHRVPRESMLFFLVLIVSSVPLVIAGLLLLVVGVFVVVAYLHLVQAHLLAQLADLYESRGGESIAGLSSEMPTPPPLPG